MSDLLMTQSNTLRPASRVAKRNLFQSLRMAFRTYMTRKTLSELTSRELADIGISAPDALAEAARLPWDITPRPRRPDPSLMAGVQRALERGRTRRLLSRMQAQELHDVGLSRSNAQTEASKFFWQA